MKNSLVIFCLIVIYSCGSKKVENNQKKMEDLTVKKVNNEFLIENPSPEKFNISNLKDTLIQLKSGKIVFFPKNTFDIASGSSDKINISVTDVSLVSDILKSGISTSDKSSVIETNGMVKIEAKNEGSDVFCTLKKNYVLGFPIPKEKNNITELASDFILFNGVNESQSKISWGVQKNDGDLLNKTISVIDYKIVIAQNDSLKYNQPDFLTISNVNTGFRKYFSEEFLRRTKHIKKSIVTLECDHLNDKGVTADVIVKKDGSLLFKNYSSGNFKNKEIQNIIESIIKDCPKIIPFYDNEGKARDNFVGIWIGVKKEYTAGTMEEFKTKFKQKLKFQEKNGNTVISKDELDYMLFESNSLGWINCDRFVNFKGERCNFMASISNLNDFDKVVPYFIFTRINSAIQFNPDQKGNYYVPNIPVGEKGYVIALGYKGDKVYFFDKECSVSKSTFEFKIEEPLNANSFDRIDKLWNCDYGGKPLL